VAVPRSANFYNPLKLIWDGKISITAHIQPSNPLFNGELIGSRVKLRKTIKSDSVAKIGARGSTCTRKTSGQKHNWHPNIHALNFEGDDYHVRTEKSLKENEELFKAGVEYVTERDGVKIYRKRK